MTDGAVIALVVLVLAFALVSTGLQHRRGEVEIKRFVRLQGQMLERVMQVATETTMAMVNAVLNPPVELQGDGEGQVETRVLSDGTLLRRGPARADGTMPEWARVPVPGGDDWVSDDEEWEDPIDLTNPLDNVGVEGVIAVEWDSGLPTPPNAHRAAMIRPGEDPFAGLGIPDREPQHEQEG